MHSVRDMALGALIASGIAIGYQTIFVHSQTRATQEAAAASVTLAPTAASASVQTVPIQVATGSSPIATNDTASPKTPSYEYKLMTDVDPCTFTTLGRAGWDAVEFGTDADANQELHNGAGKDASCVRSGIYEVFVWVLFKRTTNE